jgi:hypothetical protein
MNPKVDYRIHLSPQLYRIPSQVNPVHTLKPNFLRLILILSSHLRLGLPNGVCYFRYSD